MVARRCRRGRASILAWLTVALASVAGAGCSAEVLAPASASRASHPTQMSLTAACPTAPTDARALVPDDAVGIVGVDLSALGRSTWFPDLEAVARAHPDVARALAILEPCGVTPKTQRHVVLGISASDEVVAIVRADGLGTPATLDCVATELEATLGVSPWKRRTTGCTSVLDVTAGEGRGFALDADTVVLTTRGWSRRVGDLVEGKGGSAMTGKLAWAWSHVDVTRTLWFAALLSAEQAAALGSFTASLRKVGGSLDAPAGLNAHLTGGFVGEGAASTAARTLGEEISRVKLAAPMFGVPASLVGDVVVVAHGMRVDLTATISASDLRALRKVVVGEADPPASGGAANPGI